MGYTRKASDYTRELLSQKQKAVWARRSEIDKEKIKQKQSATMKRIWSTVPKVDETPTDWEEELKERTP